MQATEELEVETDVDEAEDATAVVEEEAPQ